MERVKLEKINFAPYNPRIMSKEIYEKLKKSIIEFGFVEPLIVNKRNMQVVGGNQRLKALKDLGVEEAEVVYVDLNDEEEKTLNIALNRISGYWDYEKLREVLEEFDEEELDLTGFNERGLKSLLGDYKPSEVTKEATRNVKKIKCPKCGYEFIA